MQPIYLHQKPKSEFPNKHNVNLDFHAFNLMLFAFYQIIGWNRRCIIEICKHMNVNAVTWTF